MPLCPLYDCAVNLDGILPPCATPFTGDEAVDLDGLRANVQRWMRTGLRGLVLLGSNGEAPFIEPTRSSRWSRPPATEIPADRVLLAGTGRQSTRQTRRGVPRRGARRRRRACSC